MTIKKLRKLMTRKQAAAYLEETPNTIALWDYRKSRDLKPIKFNGSVRYLRENLDKYLEESLRK